jgi:quercetin dioxygenase-like cupin family protein
MPFIDVASVPARPTVPGFVGRFIHGERQTIAVWEIAAGSASPMHQHPHEQTITVLSGQFELTMAGETRVLVPGLMALVPSNVPHGGRALTDCHMLDTFAPVREDYR